MIRPCATVIAFALLGCAAQDPETSGSHFAAPPSGKADANVDLTTPISLHGGPIMLGGVDFYFLYYGQLPDDHRRWMLEQFAQNLGGSPYFNMITTYDDGHGNRAANATTYVGGYAPAYERGTQLAWTDVIGVVEDGLASHSYPVDRKGLYVVLGSADVHVDGFCDQMMGGHGHFWYGGTPIKIAYVGDPTPCANFAAGPSPNGDAAGDEMANVLAHEVFEAVTDPRDGGGWYDQFGYEVGDKCAWQYGPTYAAANGAAADTRIGQADYLLQQEWVNDGAGYCGMYW